MGKPRKDLNVNGGNLSCGENDIKRRGGLPGGYLLMSFELNIYGRDKTLAKVKNLKEWLAAVGWECVLLSDLAELTEAEDKVVRLGDIVGWMEDSEQAEAMREALKLRDKDAIQKFFEQEKLACVEVICEEDFSADPEELEELEEDGIEPEYLAVLKDSPLCYYLRTSARSSELSLQFQIAVWTSLGLSIYGLLHDPESDVFRLPSLEGEEEG